MKDGYKINWCLSGGSLCSHKPRPKSFGRAFSKARRVLGRRPESPLASGEIPLSSVKGRRGEVSCQSNSRGEPTRSEGFSLLVYRYFIQYKGRAPHPPRSSAPSPRGKAKSAPFRLYKPTDKSKFETQTSPSWYTKTGFIIQTSMFARGGFPARLKI